jgi:phosphatidate cytidylyltransferase
MARSAPRIHGNELATRIGSAVVLAPVVLAVVHFGSPYFEGLIAIVAAILAWEWSRLCGADSAVVNTALIVGVALGAVAFVVDGHGVLGYGALIAGAVGVAILDHGPRRLWLAAGVLYIGVPLAAFVWLRAEPTFGRDGALWLLLAVWATDIGAYAFGRLIGGPKLAPHISPKKTWAGLIGGMVCAMLVGAIVAGLLGKGGMTSLALLSGVVGAVSQGGDLLESWIKRHFQIKDMGTLIPGHGGLFDRVDGLLAALVLVGLVHWLGEGRVFSWS